MSAGSVLAKTADGMLWIKCSDGIRWVPLEEEERIHLKNNPKFYASAVYYSYLHKLPGTVFYDPPFPPD